MEDAVELGPGSQLGDYILESRLGGGSFGTVWLAHHKEYGPHVAVKTLTGALAARSTPTLRAEVELLAATASSRSSHVVRVLDGGTDPVPYVVMEFIEGRDLASILRTKRVLLASEVVRIGIAVADALSALDAVGIIHRDVKPANVMIDEHGVVKLTDFGIAKIVGFDTTTTTGQIPMTMAYAAPEAWEGEASAKSDLYSFGIMLYECLAGSPPFTGTFGSLFRHHASSEPDLTRLPEGTPNSLVSLIAACLAKQPVERPVDARECGTILEAAQAELEEEDTRKRAEERARLRPPTRLGPWILISALPDQSWAWQARHHETGEAAILEVHAADGLNLGASLKRAVAANPKLVQLGAERLFGSNRFILRPGEGWPDGPQGEFLFWLAREGTAPDPSDEAISLDIAEHVARSLKALRREATAEGVDIGLCPQRLIVTQNGSIHYRRPGLPVVGSEVVAEDGVALLRALPLDDEARSWLGQFDSLDAIAESPSKESDTRDIGLGVAIVGGETSQADSESATTIAEADTSFGTTDVAHSISAPAEVLVSGSVLSDAIEEPPSTNLAEISPDASGGGSGDPPRRWTLVVPHNNWWFGAFAVLGVGVVSAVAVALFLLLIAGGKGGSVAAAAFDITSIRCVPDSPQIGVAVSCTGEVTGGVSQLTWSAADGQPPSGSNPVLVTSFSSQGVKQITLQACISPDKCVSKTTQVTVAALEQGKISCQSLTVGVGQAVSCQTAETGGGQLTWHADGGKPPDGSGNQFTTEFDTPGNMQVQLKSCSGSDCTVQDTAQISVVQGPAIKSVTCQPSAVQISQEVDCTADVSGNITTWSWLAPGGTPTTGANQAFSTSFGSEGVVAVNVQACAGPTLCANGSSTVTVSLPCFNLHLNLGGGSGNPPAASSANCGPGYKQGTVVSLSASPSVGWRVDHWQDADSSGASTTNSVTMNGDQSVRVYYQEIPVTNACYTLTLTAGSGVGSTPVATPSPNCPSDPSRYAANTVVALSAYPSTGWKVVDWIGSDNDGSTATSNTVTMSANRSVQIDYSLASTPIPIAIPAPPSNVLLTTPDPYTFQLSWTDNSSNEDGFEISDASHPSYFVGPNATSFTHTGQNPGDYGCFHLRSYNSAGSSDWEPSAPPYYVCGTTPQSPSSSAFATPGGHVVSLGPVQPVNSSSVGFAIEISASRSSSIVRVVPMKGLIDRVTSGQLDGWSEDRRRLGRCGGCRAAER